jgi:hypothetical protein
MRLKITVSLSPSVASPRTKCHPNPPVGSSVLRRDTMTDIQTDKAGGLKNPLSIFGKQAKYNNRIRGS